MASVMRKNDKWYVRYKDETGKWRDKLTPAASKAEAKRFAAEIDSRIWKIGQGMEVAPTDSGMTLGSMLDWWLETRSAETASHLRNESYVRVHIAETEFSKLPLHFVTTGKIEEFLHEKNKTLSPSSINHLRGYLQAAFNAAKHSGLFTGANPVTDTKRRRVPKRKPDYLRPHEVPPMLAALSDKYRNLFACAIYTGLRKGELMGLHKRDIDWTQRHIYVRHSHGRDTTKSGEDGVVPIAAELMPFLQSAVAASKCKYVFPGTDGEAMRADTPVEEILRRAMARAGIVEGFLHVCRFKGCGHRELHTDSELRHCPMHGHKLWPKAQVRPIRFHDLRHTTASLLTMAGANPAAVQKILRHADPRITMSVYAHLSPGYLQGEVDRLSFFGGAANSQAIAGISKSHGAVVGLAEGKIKKTAGTVTAKSLDSGRFSESRGQDLNLGPSGYEPDELPGCSTPQQQH